MTESFEKIETGEEALALKAALTIRLTKEIESLHQRMLSIYRNQTLDNAPLLLYGLTGELNAIYSLRDRLEREHRGGVEALAKEHQNAAKLARQAATSSFL